MANQFDRSDSDERRSLDEDVMKMLAEVIKDALMNRDGEKLDPAESYSKELQCRLIKDSGHFRDKFSEGYCAIMDILKTEN